MEQVKEELIIEELPKNKKNIIFKVLLILVAIVGMALIVLNYIPVKYSVNLHQDNIQSITLYQNGNASSEIYKSVNEQKFNEVLNKFNQTYSVDDIAFALFSGKISNKESVNSKDTRYNAISNIAKNANSKSKYILFNYATEQQIMVNGEIYSSNTSSSATKKYTQALIEITDNQSLTETKIYYITASGTCYHTVTFNTTGAELYEYIDNFF